MKIFWVTIIGLLIIGLSGCVDLEKVVTDGLESEPSEILTPIYEVEYSTITDAGKSYLKVKITGIRQSYKVILSDPDGSTAGIAQISKDDMIDGVETVNVQMSEYGKTPKIGAYTLLIKQTLNDDIVYVTKPVFEELLIGLDDIKFESSKYCYGICKYKITKVKFTITNYGDIPAIINYALVTTGGENDPARPCSTRAWGITDREPKVMDRQESKIRLMEGLAPNESKEITSNVYISELRKGYYHRIFIDIYTEQKEVTGTSKNFLAGCKQ